MRAIAAPGCVAGSPLRRCGDVPAVDRWESLGFWQRPRVRQLTVCKAGGEDQNRSTIGREFHDLGAGSRDKSLVTGKPIDLVGHELAGSDMDTREVSTLDAGL